MSLAGSEPSQTLRVSEHRAELGAGGAAHSAAVTRLSKLDVDLFPYGALIVVMEDVAISLPNGVPRWDLCHQNACLAGVAMIGHRRTPLLCAGEGSGLSAFPDVVNSGSGFVHQGLTARLEPHI